MLRSRHAGLTGSLRISCTLHTSPFNSPWTRRTSWSIRACRQSGEGPERYPGSEYGAPLVRDRRDGRDDDDARVCGLAQEGDQSRREKVHAVDVDCGQALGRAGWTCPCGVAGLCDQATWWPVSSAWDSSVARTPVGHVPVLAAFSSHCIGGQARYSLVHPLPHELLDGIGWHQVCIEQTATAAYGPGDL